MRRKQFEKKLGLNKITVTNLSRLGMEEVRGGAMILCSDACTDGCAETVVPALCEGTYPGTSNGNG